MAPATATVAQIVSEPRIFSLQEARELFPLVRRITADASNELEPVRHSFENMLPTDPRLHAVEQKYEAVVRRWVAKMERLGLVVKGLWLVDFDTGDGCLCWKHPELNLGHFHDYDSGFDGRRRIAEVIEETAPDWA